MARGGSLAVSNETAVTEGNNLSLMYGTYGVGKGGAGAYTLPRGQVYSPDPLKVSALQGTVAVTTNGSLPAVSVPSEVLNMSSFWLDASVNLQTNANGEITAWYDCREAKTGDAWGASYVRAKTDLSPKNSSSVVYTPVMPVATTPAGTSLPMVYFGGYQKGTGMTFYNTSSTSATGFDTIYHVYMVANFQKSYSYPFGASGSLLLHPTAFASESIKSNYNSADSYPFATEAEFLVNGGYCNPMHTAVRTGLQLIEIHASSDAPMASFGRLFNDRGIDGRYGGDYIGEVLVFNGTKASLTDSERRQVSRYLMDKWGITPDAGKTTVFLGEGATLQSTEQDVTVAGRGTAERTGTETAHYRPTAADPASGPKVHLASGTMQADAREINLTVRSGDALSFAIDRLGVHTVTAGTAPAGEAVISDADEVVRLGRIDEGVTNVTVGAKSVVLGDAVVGGALLQDEVGVATVANGSFEKTFSASDWVWVNKNGSSGTKTFNAETDVLDWRIAGGEPDPDTFKKNYRLSRFMPTDGSKALILKMANLFYGHVNVSKDGDYVLAFDATGRMWYDNMQLVLSLVDAAENTNTFACCTIPIGNGYHPFRYLLPRLKAGAYKLLIEALNGKANQTNDSHALLDNFRMTPVFDGLSAVGGVPVPNGSFENTRITSSSRVVTTFGTNDLLCAGWTLTSPASPAAGAVSPVSRLMKNYYVPNEHDTGVWQLRFHGNTGRATSAAFSLPAGSWTLRCKAAKWAYDGVRWNNYTARNYTPKVGVRVFVNGTQAFDETSGFLEMYEMQTVAFKNVLTVTAADQVVIEIRQAADKAFMNVDDIEVVPLDAWGSAADLVTDGTFAGGTGNWKTKGDLWHKILNGGYEEHYGGERCDDANALCLKDSAAIWQDLNFPVAGAYRLSFWARSRISHYGTGNAPDTLDFGGNALRASLIVGGVTNTIVETPRVVSTNFNRTVALFTVPSAGKHTLCIAGINDPDAGIWTGGRREDANVLIDCVAVIPAPEAGAAPKLPEDLALKLTGDSKLRLDYVGEATVHKLKIGTKRYHGRVDATVAPGIVTGPGALNVTEPKPGMIFLVR